MNYFSRSMLMIVISLLGSTVVTARGVYQTPRDFVKETFSGKTPKVKFVWLDKQAKQQITKILGHSLNALRIRYWAANKKTAWILEEIGKEELITVGFVVTNGRIERIKILVFRESRGWEVRYPFFTDQFKQIELTHKIKLSRTIDSISGATLSVNAVSKMARLALFFYKLATDG